jgi:hypothetical protein
MCEDILWWKGGEDIKRAQELELAADEDNDEAEEVEKVEDAEVIEEAQEAEVQDDLHSVDHDIPGDVDDDIQQFVECAKSGKMKRGQRFQCVSSRRSGRHALTFMLSYKKGSTKKAPAFQVTCDHHEKDQYLNKNGKPYSLQCRRTSNVKGDTPEDEQAAMKELLRWIRQGPAYQTRIEHQDMPDEDCYSSSSSISDEAEDASTAPSPQVAPASAEDAAAAAPPPVATASSRVDFAHSQVGIGGGRAPELRGDGGHQRWLCGDMHEEASCSLYTHLIFNTDPMERYVLAFRPLGIVGQNGVVIPSNLAQVRDVPANGDCLFHSLGYEISESFRL